MTTSKLNFYAIDFRPFKVQNRARKDPYRREKFEMRNLLKGDLNICPSLMSILNHKLIII